MLSSGVYCGTPQRPELVCVACAQYLDNTLSPYPGRIGDGLQAALLSSVGDGIHSVGATMGPLVRGNTLLNMGDDGITVHGIFFLVAQVRCCSICLQCLKLGCRLLLFLPVG